MQRPNTKILVEKAPVFQKNPGHTAEVDGRASKSDDTGEAQCSLPFLKVKVPSRRGSVSYFWMDVG